jgi:hypothetical protein
MDMPPPLARALAALTCARGPGNVSLDVLGDTFVAAVVQMDLADREYRTTIEQILPAPKARELLAAMASFRSSVSELRERTRATAGYGDFDPLDTYVPSLAVSHAQSVRSANVADLARGEVAEMRTEVNARIGALLEREDIERLTDAKRTRNAAFDRAIRDVVPTGTSDRLATELMLLADGWY